MKMKVLIPVIIAVSLIITGLVFCTCALFIENFDFKKLATDKYQSETYTLTEDFTDIEINVDTDDIEFLPSDDGICKVICTETDKLKHSVRVEKGKLIIKIMDKRRWFDHIGIFFGESKMTVYLPKSEFEFLFIENDTGDIKLPSDFSFGSAEIETDTGDINFNSAVISNLSLTTDTGNIGAKGISSDKLSLETDTGNISIISATVGGITDIETDTGDVKLEDVKGGSLKAESSTGNITFKNTVLNENIEVENDTGDVKFDGSDANEIYVKTSTGDVGGNFITEKVFVTQTSTGKINVPESTNGGKCKITTSTGDINFIYIVRYN